MKDGVLMHWKHKKYILIKYLNYIFIQLNQYIIYNII